MVIFDADNELKEAHSLQKKDLRKAIKMVNGIILRYSEAKEKANKDKFFKPLSETLETRIINCRKFQYKLQEKMDELIGITLISKKIKIDEINIIDSEIPSVRKEEEKKPILSIIREFEFIGGQIRFKVGLKNNSLYSLTSLKITFDIPKVQLALDIKKMTEITLTRSWEYEKFDMDIKNLLNAIIMITIYYGRNL